MSCPCPTVIASDQVSANCPDQGPAAAAGTCMCGKRAKAPRWDPLFLDPRLSIDSRNSEGMEETQEGATSLLYIWNMLVQGLTINKASMLHFETISLTYPNFCLFLTVHML